MVCQGFRHTTSHHGKTLLSGLFVHGFVHGIQREGELQRPAHRAPCCPSFMAEALQFAASRQRGCCAPPRAQARSPPCHPSVLCAMKFASRTRQRGLIFQLQPSQTCRHMQAGTTIATIAPPDSSLVTSGARSRVSARCRSRSRPSAAPPCARPHCPTCRRSPRGRPRRRLSWRSCF